jgi:hypothetical protein
MIYALADKAWKFPDHLKAALWCGTTRGIRSVISFPKELKDAN